MRAAVYYKNSDIRIEEVEDIPVASNEMKIRVKSCGVCGSDVMEWYRIKRAGRPGGVGAFGHECTGVIEEIGTNVNKEILCRYEWRIGERVVYTHHVPCYSCSACLSGHTTACKTLHSTKFKNKYGAYAEYVVLPSINIERGLFKLPNNVSFDEGTFVEPLGCVLRGQRWADVGDGKSVLIIGSGLSGLLHLKTAILNGAGFIAMSDVNIHRLKVAQDHGANAIIDATNQNVPKKFRQLNNGYAADIVIMTAPLEICIEQSYEAIAPGGTILFFTSTKPDVSTNINFWDLWTQEITIRFSYGADYRDLNTALNWIEHGRIDVNPFITNVFPLSETSKGFMLTAHPQEGSLKSIIHPQE
ncbi:MAG: putative L-threonine 3-dehydrogenase [Promethearchaeota archaeon]|nr:MAG: putative L-threonine 3-dehydrogenase [Candidatus Lokiarchaeota archaeon]